MLDWMWLRCINVQEFKAGSKQHKRNKMKAWQIALSRASRHKTQELIIEWLDVIRINFCIVWTFPQCLLDRCAKHWWFANSIAIPQRVRLWRISPIPKFNIIGPCNDWICQIHYNLSIHDSSFVIKKPYCYSVNMIDWCRGQPARVNASNVAEKDA